MNFTEKFEFSCLRAAVKGHALEGMSLRKEIHRKSGDERGFLRNIKHRVGSSARYYYIAYGMVRGIPYKQIEAKCSPHNEPWAQIILDIINYNCPYTYAKEWSLEKVKAYLEGVAP